MLGKTITTLIIIAVSAAGIFAEETPAARITGNETGWQPLKESDFIKVNSADDTWKFDDAVGTISCTGMPISVMSTGKAYTNFELIVEWMHEKPAGNSGIFIWTDKAALDALTAPGLPDNGIEVQVLDLGYTEFFEKSSGGKADWFTCHGDVFPVGKAKLTPFTPVSPDGTRSFPSAKKSKPHGEWNHYYIRAINGEVRLWVNGTEVSGGKNSIPNSGHICLESEGSPIQFRNLKIRELP